MFKFLFGKNKKEVEVVQETQRETVSRAMGEVNEVLGSMAVKAKIAVNLETGLVEIELPEQMPDEALALPAPGAEADNAKQVEETAKDAVKDTLDETVDKATKAADATTTEKAAP